MPTALQKLARTVLAEDHQNEENLSHKDLSRFTLEEEQVGDDDMTPTLA